MQLWMQNQAIVCGLVIECVNKVKNQNPLQRDFPSLSRFAGKLNCPGPGEKDTSSFSPGNWKVLQQLYVANPFKVVEGEEEAEEGGNRIGNGNLHFLALLQTLFPRVTLTVFCSAINPILYNAMSDKFRKAFRRLLSCGKLTEPPHNHLYCYNQDQSRVSPCGVAAKQQQLHHQHTNSHQLTSSSSGGVQRRNTTTTVSPAFTSRSGRSGTGQMRHQSHHLSPDWKASASVASSPVRTTSGSCNAHHARVSVATQAGGSSRLQHHYKADTTTTTTITTHCPLSKQETTF